MRAQNLLGAFLANVESILQGTRWVIRLEVQSVEVEVLCFNLRAFSHFPSHADEDIRHGLIQCRDRVQSTGLGTGGGNGDVHGLSGELFFARLFFEYLVNARKVLFCLTARHVNKATGIFALSFRQGSQ